MNLYSTQPDSCEETFSKTVEARSSNSSRVGRIPHFVLCIIFSKFWIELGKKINQSPHCPAKFGRPTRPSWSDPKFLIYLGIVLRII